MPAPEAAPDKRTSADDERNRRTFRFPTRMRGSWRTQGRDRGGWSRSQLGVVREGGGKRPRRARIDDNPRGWLL